MSCPFCSIVWGEAPARILYQDAEALAFEDIRPQAPVHILVIPKRHVERLASATEPDTPLLGHLLSVARRLAKEKEILKSGFRIVINSGPEGGETVSHLHLHLIGGRAMSWPPG